MTAAVACPNCRAGMESLAMDSHIGQPFHIDACWSCHMIWFDKLEGTALSANSVVALFRRIHEAQKDPHAARNLIGTNMRCPSCSSGLKLVNDMQRGGRFAYHRCSEGHGRASSFTQFLREKNFIRSLTPKEISALSVKIKQIRCSSCGASVNLDKDTACTHCGSAISVLDNDAVGKALADWDERQSRPPSPEALGDAILASSRSRPRPPPGSMPFPSTLPDVLTSPPSYGIAADLVEIGISLVFKRLFD
jgi:DNA-directed RNA polymerase subunit RPC12/RpoP/Zn-finger nucleic acid-binding protein